MNADEFIKKWEDKLDTDDTPLVGVDKNWDKIKDDSLVIQFKGEEAWQKIYKFTPPWYAYGMRLPFRDLIDSSREYQNEIKREKEKKEQNKFDYILKYGLSGPLSPTFIAFADLTGSRGVLGDGCHRFLVADFVIRDKMRDLSEDIKRTEIDIICLENFSEVLSFDPF